MESARLSNQINAYLQWRQQIHQELTRYRGWLIDHNLRNPELEKKLAQAMQTLKDDKITIAFVGEYSRGKTELINALFLSHFGARILPSGAGRTTMCPTELFFNPLNPRSYLRLLPIETRKLDVSLAALREQDDQWEEIALHQQDSQQMKSAFEEVAQIKRISREEAAELGFQVEMLEQDDDDPNLVYVPRWRHAMISIDHPLFRQGLIIMDTPGLNALGCEPELTFSLLPEAQCILLLLSASSGVTATDLEIWNNHIHDLASSGACGVYAVLNKIDSVWDELENEASNKKALEKIRQHCAKQLNISAEEILCVSAKEGLLAQVSGNLERLNKSHLPELEDLLSNDMMRRKEILIQQNVITDMHAMLHASRKTLLRRRTILASELKVLRTKESDRKEQLENMLEEATHQQSFYQKKIIALRNQETLVFREGAPMLDAVSLLKLDSHLTTANESLSSSWTVMGMNTAIETYFEQLKQDMALLDERQQKVQHLVASIFAEYESEQSLAPLHYPRFDTNEYIERLNDLQTKSGSFGKNLRKLLTEQKATSQRFLTTVINEGASIYRKCFKGATEWLDNALLPLFLIAQEQKHLLDENVNKLKSMDGSDNNIDQRIDNLNELLEDIKEQTRSLDAMVHGLRKPPPMLEERARQAS